MPQATFDYETRRVHGAETVVILSDVQFPLHDPRALNVALATIEYIKPNVLIFNGDMTDATLLGEYTKNPDTAPLALEILLMQELIRAYPEPLKIWIEGNHEDRWRRFLWKHAPALTGLVSLAELTGAVASGVVCLPYGDYVDLGQLMVTHGDIVRKHSAYTARAHFEKYGQSVLHGHTHRMGAYYHTNRRGIGGAWENGHLCDADKMDYVSFPDWQQGFSVVHCTSDGGFNVQQLPILPGGRVLYGGKEIRA